MTKSDTSHWDANAVIVELYSDNDSRVQQKIVGRNSQVTNVQEFRGIPYGTVPARWQHSEVRKSLPSDMFDATKNGPRCPQPHEPNNTDMFHSYLAFPDVEESEFDCLNLFVIRPSPAALAQNGLEQSNLPVYVYFHGGGFGWGAATDPIWDPTRLVARSLESKKPMIVVMVNYRLQIFGFAGCPEIIEAQPHSKTRGSNFGIGDQRTALKWVKHNISAFGGDPEKITAGGQSAGSCSVNAHVIEAQYGPSEPLFRRAIMQSGALDTLGPISMDEASGQFTALSKTLGKTSLEVGDYTQTPAKKLLEAALKSHGPSLSLINDGLTIKPTPDGDWRVDFEQVEHDSVEPKGHVGSPIAVLLGYLNTEGQIIITQVQRIRSFEDVKSIFSRILSIPAMDDLLETYNIKPTSSLSDIHQNVMHFLSDKLFGYPAYLARTRLSSPQSSCARPTTVQNYRMGFGNPVEGPNQGVAHHNVDHMYIFDCFHEDLRKADEKVAAEGWNGVTNAELVKKVQAQWIDFITADDAVTIREDQVITYGKDKVVRIEEFNKSEEWKAQERRFEVLHRYRVAMSPLTNAILSWWP